MRDATRHTVTEWVRILAAAPMPRGRGKGGGPGIARSHVPAPAAPRHVSRVHAKLVPPEPEPVVEELPSDVEMPEPENVPEQNPDVDIPEPDDPRDPMDDPVPRPRLKRERKTD
nr:hypothetical protein [Candidatus Sigynarchaeum springense]